MSQILPFLSKALTPEMSKKLADASGSLKDFAQDGEKVIEAAKGLMDFANAFNANKTALGLFAADLKSQTIESNVSVLSAWLKAMESPAGKATSEAIAALVNKLNEMTAGGLNFLTDFSTIIANSIASDGKLTNVKAVLDKLNDTTKDTGLKLIETALNTTEKVMSNQYVQDFINNQIGKLLVFFEGLDRVFGTINKSIDDLAGKFERIDTLFVKINGSIEPITGLFDKFSNIGLK